MGEIGDSQAMHPELIPGWPIHSYGLMLVVGFYAAYFLSRWTAKQEGVNPDRMVDILLIGAILGIVGARLFYVIQYSEEMGGVLDFVAIWKGGLVFYGGLIAATVGLLIYIRWKKLPVWRVADAAAPAIMLGVMFGRIGCFLNGCCWGERCDERYALAVRFPRIVAEAGTGGCRPVGLRTGIATPDGRWVSAELRGAGDDAVSRDEYQWLVDNKPEAAKRAVVISSREDLIRFLERRPDLARRITCTWVRQVAQPDGTVKEERIVGSSAFLQHLVRYAKEIGPDDERSLPVHPTQLYASFEGLVICGVLLLWRRWRRRPGEVFALMLLLYAVGRFAIEGYRVDTEPVLAGLTIAQVISVPMFIGSMAALVWCRRSGGGGRQSGFLDRSGKAR